MDDTSTTENECADLSENALSRSKDSQVKERSLAENPDDINRDKHLMTLTSSVKRIDQGHITSSKFYRLTEKSHKRLIAARSSGGNSAALQMLLQTKDSFIRQKMLAAGFALWSNGLTTIINEILTSVQRTDETAWKMVSSNLCLCEKEVNRYDFEGKHIVEGDICKLRSLQLNMGERKLSTSQEYSLRAMALISHCAFSSWSAGITQGYLFRQWQNLRSHPSPNDLFNQLSSGFEQCYHYLLIDREVDNFAHLESMMLLGIALQTKLKLAIAINKHTLKLYLNEYKLSTTELGEAETLLLRIKEKYTKYLAGINFNQYIVKGWGLKLCEAVLKVRIAQNKTAQECFDEAYDLLHESCSILDDLPRDINIENFAVECPNAMKDYIHYMQDQLRPKLNLQNHFVVDVMQCPDLCTGSPGSLEISTCSESVESDIDN